MTKKKYGKPKSVIIISTFCVLIAVFIIGYGIGLIIANGSDKSQANNEIVDLSKKNTEQISEGNNNLDKENTETHEDNKSLDKKDNVSNEDDKNTKQQLDDTKSGQDQSNKDIDVSKLTTKEIWDIYNEGNRLYKQGNYEKALPKLEKSYEIKPDSNLMPWITYQLGNCYKELNDNANALVYFKKVIKNYPSSQFVASAERMIKAIESR
ncbi:tetratricopeptide repeat protein [Clostridium peptidivorans]|uniref:tetratricopeptide repeat protein n=1 Tax=Clostridium peptidivorans TaxID=100174 RepID=UPI000BE36792|nr:tetratricopeptide repeat protein [Clostridium peptidivorans]